MIQKGLSGLRARLTGRGSSTSETGADGPQHVRITPYTPEMANGTDGIEALRQVLGTDGPEPLEEAIYRVRKEPTHLEAEEAAAALASYAATQPTSQSAKSGDAAAEDEAQPKVTKEKPEDAKPSKSGGLLSAALSRATAQVSVFEPSEPEQARKAPKSQSQSSPEMKSTTASKPGTKSQTLPKVEPEAPPAARRRFGALMSAMRLGSNASDPKDGELSPRVQRRIASDPFVKRLARLN